MIPKDYVPRCDRCQRIAYYLVLRMTAPKKAEALCSACNWAFEGEQLKQAPKGVAGAPEDAEKK